MWVHENRDPVVRHYETGEDESRGGRKGGVPPLTINHLYDLTFSDDEEAEQVMIFFMELDALPLKETTLVH